MTSVQDIVHATAQGYEALSYVWGNMQDRMQIALNDQEAFVTQNLYIALQHLRLHTQPRRLWIDAICIDQQNTMERNHQVGMMRDVFSAASQVIAWWGPEIKSTLGTVGIFTKLLYSKRHNWDIPIGQADMAAIALLPYWTRVWIVPEMVVAREITIQWGAYSMAWSDLIDYVREWHFLYKPLEVIIKTMDLRYYESRQRNLVNLLHATEVTESTDPRDKVFALLGLINNDVSEPIVADYTMSPCEVYSRAIRTMYKEACLNMKDESGASPRLYVDRLALPESHPGAWICNGGSCGRRDYCLKILPWELINERKGVEESWPEYLGTNPSFAIRGL